MSALSSRRLQDRRDRDEKSREAHSKEPAVRSTEDFDRALKELELRKVAWDFKVKKTRDVFALLGFLLAAVSIVVGLLSGESVHEQLAQFIQTIVSGP